MTDETVVPIIDRPPLENLSDAVIQQIHDGLIVPSEDAIHAMAREIRKWRGSLNPDAA